MDARAQGTVTQWGQECQATVLAHSWPKLHQLAHWLWCGDSLAKDRLQGAFKERHEGEEWVFFFPGYQWQNVIFLISNKKQRKPNTELTLHDLVHLRQDLNFFVLEKQLFIAVLVAKNV